MSFLPTLVLFVVVVSTAIWVSRDSRALEAQGMPVVVSLGGRRIGSPVLWTVGCLLLWVVFIPVDLAARRTITG